MNLNPIKANMTELETPALRVLFSYKTPVAVIESNGGVYKTSKRWSNTTSRHINQWFKLYDLELRASEKPQEYFDGLIAEVK